MPFIIKHTRREKFAAAALAGISILAYGNVGYNLLGRGDSLRTAGQGSTTPASVVVKQPLSVNTFKQQINDLSDKNMTVVVLRRTECPSCAEVSVALEDIRDKLGFPYTVYEIDAQQNPDVAKFLQQRDPQAEARLHIFYKGEKIHESIGISTNPAYVQDYLFMADALAKGEVSILDRYKPPAP